MKPVAIALVGPPGSGTSIIAERAASILRWPFASFGAYVRGETAKRGLVGTYENLQNVGMELLKDVESFSRSVLAQSRWRPGRCLIIDGLRHKEVFHELTRLLHPTPVSGIYIGAKDEVREAHLLKHGETHPLGLSQIDQHPVEQEVFGSLRSLSNKTVEMSESEESVVDDVVEYLMQQSEIPPHHSKVTGEGLIRLPREVRSALGLQPGDLLEVDWFERYLVARKIVDEARMRSAFGRLQKELEGVDPEELARQLRWMQEDNK